MTLVLGLRMEFDNMIRESWEIREIKEYGGNGNTFKLFSKLVIRRIYAQFLSACFSVVYVSTHWVKLLLINSRTSSARSATLEDTS